MTAVAFRYDKAFAGFGHCRGLVNDGGDHLLFEFQTRDAMFNVPLGGIRTVKVPIADLASVELTPGLLGFGGKLVLRANRLTTLDGLPGMTQGRVELGIERKDYAAAEAFVARLHAAQPEADPAAPAAESGS
jgi:hypothetical protein